MIPPSTMGEGPDNKDLRAAASQQPALVSDQAAARLAPAGIDQAQGGRAHHSPERKAEGDKVYTPEWVARDLVEHFHPTGVVLEPCRGAGAIFRHLPSSALWCEIEEGRDFFQFAESVDWVITNPPYSQTRAFMRHSFTIAREVVLLVPARNVVSGYGTVREGAAFGGMREIRWYGTGGKLGFPMGNAIAAFHWSKGYSGPTQQTFHEDDAGIPVCKCGNASPDRYPCEACVRRDKLAAAIAAKDAARGRPLTAREKLDNLSRWLAEEPASVDTHPEDGDALAAPLVSGAVPKADAPGEVA